MRDNNRTVIERVTISCRRLPQPFDDTTVAVIADVHAGRAHNGPPDIRQIVETVNGLQPDIIVLLGDIVHKGRHASRYLPLFSGLQARVGTWACLGNHEHGFMWSSKYIGLKPGIPLDEWRSMYAGAGVTLLVNEAKALQRGGSRMWLVGVDDAYGGFDDLPSALRGVDQADFCLVITHSPDLMDDARIDEVDLVLAAHTHGGQVRLPILGVLYGACRKPRQRAAGLVCENRTTMYVTRGAGEGLPIRWRCPREIPLITLRREST